MAIRPKQSFTLFDSQFEAMDPANGGAAAELLLTSAQPGTPCGASFTLRNIALKACLDGPGGAQVLLIQRHEPDLHRDHVRGDSGLLAMVREMQGYGAVEVLPQEMRFTNGSVLHWAPAGTPAEVNRLLDRRVDVLVMDRAEELTEELFIRLRETALSSSHPNRKVIAAARQATAAGWVGRHWSVNGSSGRKWLLLDPEELDPEMIRRPAFLGYRAWLEATFPDELVWAPQTVAIVDAIGRWVDGEWDHLGVFVPSQSGKTEAGPRRAVPYILRRYPADWCAVISYNAEIANSRSADARDNFARTGAEMRPGRQKVREWLTQGGGGCWSTGMGAGATGHPNTWLFLDDPDADWPDATNRVKQEKKRRRYSSVARARESQFAGEGRTQKLCGTATRWDPGDLLGYAMDQSHAALVANPGARERWGILAIPAVSDPAVQDGYRKLYPLFDVIPDFRGEVKDIPIWPARRSLADWKTIFALRGPIIAATECQQSPRGVEKGGQFEADWFERLSRDPAMAGEVLNEKVYAQCCRAWDFAWTEGGGDYTVGSKLGRMKEAGEIIVRHVVRGQFAPRGVSQLVAAAMILDGPDVKIRLPLDPAAGAAAVDEIVRYLRQVAGWVGMRVPEIVSKPPRRAATAHESAKSARARPFRSRAEPPRPGTTGGIAYVAAPWEAGLSNLVEGWSAKVTAHPELAEIAEKAALFADKATRGDWWTFWLQIFQSFTGDEGRTDDDVDATVDSYDEVWQEPVIHLSGGSATPGGW